MACRCEGQKCDKVPPWSDNGVTHHAWRRDNIGLNPERGTISQVGRAAPDSKRGKRVSHIIMGRRLGGRKCDTPKIGALLGPVELWKNEHIQCGNHASLLIEGNTLFTTHASNVLDEQKNATIRHPSAARANSNSVVPWTASGL